MRIFSFAFVLSLVLCSCASLSWQDLSSTARGKETLSVDSSVVVLPVDRPGNAEVALAYRRFSDRWWPGVPQITDQEFIDRGENSWKNVLLLGTGEDNLLLAGMKDGIPIEWSAAGITARERHEKDGVLLIKWPDSSLAKQSLFILTGTSPAAVLASKPDFGRSDHEYWVIKEKEILERGCFRVSSPARPWDSPMYLNDLIMVLPEEEAIAAGSPRVLSGAVARRTDLSGKSVLVRGTPANNQMIADIIARLPIQMNGDTIRAKRMYSGNLVLYAKAPSHDNDSHVRVLAGTNEAAVKEFVFSLVNRNLNYYDYAIFDSKTNITLEYGLYPGNESKYSLAAEPPTPKEMMLADFDRLAGFLLDSLAYIPVNRIVFGVDIPAILRQTRAGIRGDETPAEFCTIIRSMLLKCKEDHLDLFFWDDSLDKISFCDITDGFPIGGNQQFLLFGTPAADTPRVHRFYRDAISDGPIFRGPPLIYHDGAYFTVFDFIYAGRRYSRGMKLLGINGQEVSSIQQSLQHALEKWDWKNRRFYGNLVSRGEGDAFYSRMEMKTGDRLDLDFLTSDGKRLVVPYVAGERLFPAGRRSFNRSVLAKRKVVWFEKSGILYIRLPEMQAPEFYLEKIKLCNPDNVRAVVIDIRFNLGGDSQVWEKIIKALIAEPIKVDGKRAQRNSRITRNLYIWPQKKESIDFLAGEEYLINEYSRTIDPDRDSLHLRVPIYILTKDIYSAAGQLKLLASHSEQLISLGERNPIGVTSSSRPIYLYLPNSRIIVRFSHSMELGSARTAEEILATRPEIELELSLEELLEYWNMDETAPLEDNLTQHDPFFKKVLEHLGSRCSDQ